MTDKLPPNLLALFAPRPALRYLTACDHAPADRKTHNISGVAAFMPELQKEPVPYLPTESFLEYKDRKKLETQEKQMRMIEEAENKPAPTEEEKKKAMRTLFVSRLNYDTEVKDLERQFSRYGPLERVRIVTDMHDTVNGKPNKNKGKSRGYAFLVFERENDMIDAFKDCEGISIRGRRVIVDVERGHTTKGWRPRRQGGGAPGCGRHYSKQKAAPSFSGYGPPSGPGGFRGGRGGGMRGGFRGDRGGGGGFRGGGNGFRGGRGGGGGYNGPSDAPSGPRSGYGGGGGYGGGRGGYGGGRGDYGGGRGDYGGGRGGSYEDRGSRNANLEPLPPRGGGGYRDRERERDRDRDRDGGYRDRDRDGGGYSGQKRPHEGGGYEESRSRRRY